ncbi:MAG: ATP-binding protein [Gemmatimonadaceae bacterium]|nr:ATP-binding protein [Gemmatimonadaceae bacterium]HWJ43885.1 ATP-binding protein [Gaiellaceae bacterium]NUO96265.1 ATP-binding protein [Gemmatimonadaceae bacterium]NUP57133.1 ATP-binding protein [Gemmatimonadaceae bacterium]NUR35199.1 ATP-binding protein [Gemmatimonadaceae bacterium]
MSPNSLVRICVTGPESTGKTTLARRLAELLRTAWVPEASRVYAERVGRPLVASDVSPIAREHIALADAGAATARDRVAPALILDTDLLSTIVYARHYYDAVPPWIEEAERARRADLYLLCDVDVPWIADGVRDRPTGRGAMFDRFHCALTQRGAAPVVVRGDWETRWALAFAAATERLTATARRV